MSASLPRSTTSSDEEAFEEASESSTHDEEDDSETDAPLCARLRPPEDDMQGRAATRGMSDGSGRMITDRSDRRDRPIVERGHQRLR
jgi:hypothetical protein